MSRGVSRDLAWNTTKTAHGPWRLSLSPALAVALPNRILLISVYPYWHNEPVELKQSRRRIRDPPYGGVGGEGA